MDAGTNCMLHVTHTIPCHMPRLQDLAPAAHVKAATTGRLEPYHDACCVVRVILGTATAASNLCLHNAWQ
jgi:hypothetical protein